MLTARDVVGAVDYHKVHLKANDYYEKDNEIKGYWFGEACYLYGVTSGAEVTDEAFEALQANRHAKIDKKVTRRQNTVRQTSDGKLVSNRRAFFDFVFSAPKSFSVLAVTFGNDAVRSWYNLAVTAALKEMEKWTSRQDHKNPESRVEYTGKFAAAWYKHDASRALEPNLHDHVIIFNMTPSKDGHSYAIETKTFYDRLKYIIAIYRDTLAKQAIDAGCYVEYDKFGAPQIRSEHQSLKKICDHFSSRSSLRDQLVERCEKILNSTLTNREVAILVRHSRGFDQKKFEENFSKQVFSGSRYQMFKNFCNIVKRASNSKLVKTNTKVVLETQLESLSAEDRSLVKEAEKRMDGVIKKQIHPPQTLVEAFKDAVKHCFERKSVVYDYELFEVVLKKCCGRGVDPQALKDLLKQFTESKNNQLVNVGNEVTTVTHLKREQDLIAWVNKGKDFLKNPINNFKPEDKLSAEQTKVVLAMVESTDQFKVIVGKAGTGKTFALSEIVRAHSENSQEVFMFAPSNGARDVLRKDGANMKHPLAALPFTKAESLQQLLVNQKLQQSIKKGSVVILDEAGLASVEQMHAFFKLADVGGWNVQLCGDPLQHTSVNAGDSLRILLRNTTIHRTRLTNIVRQTNEEYREAAKEFANGHSSDGFRRLYKMGAITEASGKAFSKTIAEKYVALKNSDDKNSVLIVTPTHREIENVSVSIRELLKKEGKLQDEQAVDTIRSLGWTMAEKNDPRNYWPGLMIQFNKGDFKGEMWEVLGANKNKSIRCKDTEGREINLSLKEAKNISVCEKKKLMLARGDLIMNRAGMKQSRNEVVNGEILTFLGVNSEGHIETVEGKIIPHRNFTYGYASTSHKAQGSTYKNVIIGFDKKSIKMVDKKLAYVASTRGKVGIHLVVENMDDLMNIEKRTGDRTSALELLEKKREDRSELKTRANSKVLSNMERPETPLTHSLSDLMDQRESLRKKASAIFR